MNIVTEPMFSGEPLVDLRAKRSWRHTRSHIMIGLTGVSAVIIAIPLVFIVGTLIAKGAGVAFRDFPHFFTKKIPVKSEDFGPGIGPAIIGTLVITGFATLVAVPLGVLGAVYVNEYGRGSKFASAVRFLATVMTGVPSIVMGLFIYVIFTLRYGLSGVGGSLALACLMLPVVIRASEEMLKLVPDHLREASYALGTGKSRTILTVVLPSALPGIVSGCLLAVARAAGETAPLLFTIGASRKSRLNIFSGANTALPAQIFENANSSYPGARERGWGAALTLVAITFLFTVTARIVTAAYRKRR
jgi:phosphate transport system permease protein